MIGTRTCCICPQIPRVRTRHAPHISHSKTGLTGILAGSPPVPSWRGSAIHGAVPDAVLADTPYSV